MITYDFVPSSLASLDQLQTELIVLPYFSDERPLCGAAGLLDWRLCGALSRKLMAGFLDGAFGEKGLLAAPSMIRAEALLMLGLGPSEEFDESAAEDACRRIASAVLEAGISTAALCLPGRSLNRIGALEAMQLWLTASPSSDAIDEIAIIESIEEHRALESLVDGLRRQAESPLD